MNCFRLSTTWFTKRRAVDNHILDSSAVDNPLPDLKLVQNTIPLHPAVNDSLPDDILVDNHILDHPEVNYPLPDLILVNILLPSDLRADDYPLPDLTFVENPADNPVARCVLPAVSNSTCYLPVVKKNLLDLPNHIITDILIRLPAKCVFRCQLASKLLEILASTPFFIRTHLAQATSIIALQCFSQSSDREIKFYFIDEQTKKVEEANLTLDICYMKKNCPVMLYDSCDGFLLFKNKNHWWKSIFVIWNPTTEEQVTITMEGFYTVCGFYFNPHNKEYEVLLLHFVGRDRNYSVNILSFGSKLQRNIGTYSYMPRSENPPTIINGTLYWMVDMVYNGVEVNCSNSIMSFKIRTNKFSTMRHGGASCEVGRNKHGYMNLIEMEGQLGLCILKPYTTDLVLWVLNPTTNSWAKAHSVTVPQYSMPEYFSCWPNSLDVEVVNIKDSKLLVRQYNKLLLCNLVLGTHEIIEKKGFEDDNFRPVIHTPSLVSLSTDKLKRLDL